jgi:Rrf2 family protein
MKLSTRTRYGTRMLVDIARHGGQGPVQIGDVSKRQHISVKYLEQLIRPLKDAGIIKSIRGAKGGHILSQEPEQITLGEITRIFEVQSDLVACIGDPQKCSMSDDCQVRSVWQAATQAMYEKLDDTTIADLV